MDFHPMDLLNIGTTKPKAPQTEMQLDQAWILERERNALLPKQHAAKQQLDNKPGLHRELDLDPSHHMANPIFKANHLDKALVTGPTTVSTKGVLYQYHLFQPLLTSILKSERQMRVFAFHPVRHIYPAFTANNKSTDRIAPIIRANMEFQLVSAFLEPDHFTGYRTSYKMFGPVAI